MRIMRSLLRRMEAKRAESKDEGLGFDAGLTLLEVAAAIGISIILALVIVLALTGLFSSAKHSASVQGLTNVSTAVNGYYGSQGGTFAGLTNTSLLSSQATGVTFTTAAATSASGSTVTYVITDQAAVFSTYDTGLSACLYVADIGASTDSSVVGGSAATLAPGVWWASDSTCGTTPSATTVWQSSVPTAA